MTLASIFAKPIDRPIEGVIKADDDKSLRLEIEEYVLTNEVAKRLEDFLAAYTHYAGANGVWISGFFGSGKSHLLKMLALLLENRTVEGSTALELFLPKCGDNQILRADLQRAVAIPSQSILFNIDQKADVISKKQIDALLAVFVKVFDEMCGYYGKQGHIAQFERDLDSRDLYDAFKEAYAQQTGLPWESGREQALLEGRNIAAAYAQVTNAGNDAAAGILDKYRQQYKVSIEDFADQVNDYISRHGPDFRLNFLVDEVGQYIADNVKLMTNLQTIAESLATKSRGRAWLLVTAQEDMNSVVGEMGRQQSNDFSKIQARFANRMKLTSADVEEVIRKRLLLKNDRGIDLLADVYAVQQNNFKTLFDFADGGQSYRNFRDRDHFIHSYPFIPYQFPLFQAAIQNLSLHNAFEGRHSSVGERSMLGVFQEVAKRIANHQIGQLATFDLMFEGIRTALKAQIQRSVITAEQHLDSPFAVQVLKALFLVKYVKEFKATLRNLTVLMYPGFDVDLPALRRQVEEALNLLEQQTYIQRNGEEYEFLTDEEKDVEQEIKNTEIETDAVADELATFVFDMVIKHRKIRYDENSQDYPFARKLDDRLSGRDYELAIHVISPFHEHAGNEPILRAQAMGRDELLVLLPPNDRLVRDLTLYKRTEKYIRQNYSTAQQASVKRILEGKSSQNQERKTALGKLVAEMMAEAKLVVNGQEVETGSSEPQTRVVKGFHELLVRTYPNLRMLRGVQYSEADIGRSLEQANTLFGNDDATVSEAETEMRAFIESNVRSGVRTTMTTLVNRFERKPYGWYLAAIQCTLAKLIARGRVEVKQDGALLDDNAVARALRNTHGYGNLILEPQVEFTAGQVRQLRDFYAEFFDGPPTAGEAKALAQETARAFQTLHAELTQLRNGNGYPFLAVLDRPLARLAALMQQPSAFYFTDLAQHEDALFDDKEQVIAPLRQFMAGGQRQIFDSAQRFLTNQEANLSYVDGDEVSAMRRLLADPTCYTGNKMQQVKSFLDATQAKVDAVVRAERTKMLNAVDERWARLAAMSEFGDLSTAQQDELKRPFDELKRTLERTTLVAVIKDTVQRFDINEYQRQLLKMTLWAAPAVEPQPGVAEDNHNGPAAPIVEPRIEYVSKQALPVSFDRAWLADEADVDAYLSALKQALMQVIADGKRVQV
ncbi:BREX system P-loop protein BrxC [bacterium]|nr:BREX system P-loop protein BrxC [bacterium]